MRWQEFSVRCPELAAAARHRFAADQLVLLGTIRSDGAPRISPCEVDFAAGDLMLGMMWRSRKALDLRRDPRLTVHSLPADKDNAGGDIKLDGRAVEVTDPDPRERYCAAIEARIGWHPTGDYHLFALDVEHAATVRFGGDEGMVVRRWRPGGPVVTEHRAG
ncbi:pyridoxamine 5'-phosphate oxidase [Actinocatenispora thailandica]|uniref:Pyridoxamine 5'-phosphate oxidase n=1 Tax=Actinocatenispora thailandica TaxID=227318 RepID=A0A7R7DKZ7_9ACTN|nr:pyridoxamine 5'-phosphate oxidase family protein [Actinocatenispora thailandica]BCJ33669.1 pyridoxamine 5'-phosphate oxidase [Actinocatenispora thailandica]